MSRIVAPESGTVDVTVRRKAGKMFELLAAHVVSSKEAATKPLATGRDKFQASVVAMLVGFRTSQ